MRLLIFICFCILLHCTAQASVVRTTPLIQAVQSGYMPLIGQLIRGGAKVNAIDTLGRTAVHYAVSRDNQEALKLLLSNGADANLADNDGNTPLDMWHEHKNEKMLALLHAAGAKPLDLFQAAANNDRLSAERLLAAGADAKAENDAGKVPFDIAVEAEHYALAAILLKAAVGINGRDRKSWSPLNWAIFGDAWDLVRELIREGADINVGRSQNAFDVATLMESEAKLIEVFIAEKGVDTTVGQYGHTMLMLAVMRGNTEIAELLIKHKANINAKSSFSKKTALALATQYGNIEIVELLVKHKADLNMQDMDGNSALFLTAKKGDIREHFKIAELLIEKHTDVNAQNRYGETPLMAAALSKQPKTVELLIKHGAKVNAQNDHGGTALTRAAHFGYTKIVKLLIDNGADHSLKLVTGKTALDLTEEKGHDEIVAILRAAQKATEHEGKSG